MKVVSNIGDKFWNIATFLFMGVLCYIGAALIPGVTLLFSGIFAVISDILSQISTWYSGLNIIVHITFVVILGTIFALRLHASTSKE